MKLLKYCFQFFCIAQSSVGARTVVLNGVRLSSFNPSLNINSGLIGTYNAATLSMCGSMCAKVVTCVSLEYDYASHKCSLLYRTQTQTRSGTKRMYSMKKDCPVGKTAVGNTCYGLEPSVTRIHDQAEVYCQQTGGHLFSIFDSQTRASLMASVPATPGLPRFFVSGRRVGTTNTFLNWQGLPIPVNDPDDWGPLIPEDCAAVATDQTNIMDLHCFWSAEKFLCQY